MAAESRLLDAALRLFARNGVRELSVSDLANEASVARGTIYNNFENPSELFSIVALGVASEMQDSISAKLAGIECPEQRLAYSLRWIIRRAHRQPSWGQFIAAFAVNAPELARFWAGIPAQEVRQGIAAGVFKLEKSQVATAVQLLAGATFSMILLVQDGQKTWREAGQDLAELALRALGVDHASARRIAEAELPDNDIHEGSIFGAYAAKAVEPGSRASSETDANG
jgi:AcrR family transcriptional regulator